MKALLLAAGYAKRLYPLTKNYPKSLLEIGGKPVLTHILEKLEILKEIDKIYLITNNKFYSHFLDWKTKLNLNLNTKLDIEIINDNTNSEEDKLGAIGDISFAINQKQINEPLLIFGGDNLFDFSLLDMLTYFKEKNQDVVSVSKVEDKERLKHLGVVQLDQANKIIFLEEKPKEPQSTTAVNCIYFYTKDTISLFKKYLQENNNPDQPGRFLQWLYPQKPVYGFLNKGKILDIGTPESLEKARREFTSSSFV